MRTFSLRWCALLVCLAIPGGTAQSFGADDGWRNEGGRMQVSPFDLTQVRLLEGGLKEAAKRNQQYLRTLETDRLLHNFRLTAGIASSATPLGGWESPATELRGHFVGHFLSGCALMYASCGDTLLKAKADTMVAELARCQEKLGTGYLSAFPEELIDRVEKGLKVWAPWYTLHKIFQGLLDVFQLSGNRQALDVVRRMADWTQRRTDRLSDEQMQQMLKAEFGGMNETLLNLYAVTGDAHHLALAKRFEKREFLNPLEDHTDNLKGLHANTHIPQVVGAARGYEVTGEKRYWTIATFFWNQVVQARSYATGGTSNGEHWGSAPNQLSTQLGPSTEESCCSYNMLKLTAHLFTWSPDPRYADYYEKTFLNSILPTQDPTSGMLMYYKPLGSGWYKTYGTARTSFWCCTGTGVESFGRLGGNIYYHDARSVYVNLFVPSELQWNQKGLTLRQETDFPRSAATRLIVHTRTPLALRLNIRVPDWSRTGARVRVNGKDVGVSSSPGSYLVLDRTWNDGDSIEVAYQMELHLAPMPDNPAMAAIMFGPLVLAGKLSREELTDSLRYGFYGPTLPPVLSPVLLTDDKDISAWLEPLRGKPLTFRTKDVGDPHDVELVPLSDIVGERYAVYWNFFRRDAWEEVKRRSAQSAGKLIDDVTPGDTLSEEGHDLIGNEMRIGSDSAAHWVSTKDWFSVTMLVLMDRPVTLRLAYSKSDTGRRYAITIDDIALRAKPLMREMGGGMVEEEYEIPLEMTAGRRTVIVSFASQRWHDGRRLLSCALYGSTREK
jgi:DUF1680 family protein